MATIGNTALRVMFSLWLGMLVGISVIETPMKFKAPEITLERGLGIGRLVFQALNFVELGLAVVVVLALGVATGRGASRWVRILAALIIAALLFQIFGLRPTLDHRLDERIAGNTLPASYHHVAYIVLEGFKILALLAVAIIVSLPQRRTTTARPS